jgi:hypothetical protein
MRFHLVFSGALRASASNAKPHDVMNIRREFARQLTQLWKTHHALQVLSGTGAVQKRLFRQTPAMSALTGPMTPRQLAQRHSEFEDCLPALAVGGKWYLPLVRKSLDLNCELEILFLRQQDPGELVSQGGDIDNRIKTLLDALRMPSKEEQERAGDFEEDGMFCLMENDTLVSSLGVDTDRLLFPQTDRPHEVHLVIKVTLNVLRVGPHNMCLL